MPLIKSKSDKAVGKNIEKEMDAGKPQKQSIAIALSVQRKAKSKKMSDGGQVNPKPDESSKANSGGALDFHPDEDKVKKMQQAMGFSHGGEVADKHAASIAEEIMRRHKMKKMADGGQVEEPAGDFLEDLNEKAAEEEDESSEHEASESPEHEMDEHEAEDKIDSLRERLKKILKK